MQLEKWNKNFVIILLLWFGSFLYRNIHSKIYSKHSTLKLEKNKKNIFILLKIE